MVLSLVGEWNNPPFVFDQSTRIPDAWEGWSASQVHLRGICLGLGPTNQGTCDLLRMAKAIHPWWFALTRLPGAMAHESPPPSGADTVY